MKYADIYVKDVTSIPAGEHWAILTIENILIPGDERSRIAPGHGYPERTESYVSYALYLKEEDFRQELTRALKDPWKKVRGIHVIETYKAITTIGIEKE